MNSAKYLFFIFYLLCLNTAISQSHEIVIKQANKVSNEGKLFSANKILHSFVTKNKDVLSKEQSMTLLLELFNNHHAATSDSTTYYINLLKKYQKNYKLKSFDYKIAFAEGISFLKVKEEKQAMQKMVLCNQLAIYNKDIEYQTRSLKVMGLLFAMSKNYEKAKKYYNDAIRLDKNNSNFAIKLLLANCYLNEKKLDSTKIILDQIQNNASTKNDSIQLFANYAQYYLYKSEPLTSLNYANKAKELLGKQEVGGYLKDFNDNLKSDKSISEKFDKIFKNAKYETSKELVLETQKIGAKLNQDSIKEKEMLEKMLLMKDSILYQNQNKELAEIETKYQTEKKEKENLQLKQDNTQKELTITKKNTQNWILLFGIIGLLIIASIIYLFYQKTKKQNQIIAFQKAETEKQKKLVETLYGELHHHIKNNLSIINSFVSKAKRKISDTNTKEKLEILQTRIESIEHIHKKLYANNSNILTIKETIEELVNNLQHVFVGENIQIETNINDTLNIDIKKATPIILIINEFVINSFKYAFENTKNPLINIEFKEDNEQFILNLSDNGKGLNAPIDDKNNLRIIRLLTQQLDANIEIKNNNGLQINITLPK